MTAEDLPAVLAAESVLQGAPWSTGNFLDSLRAGHRMLVGEEAGEMIAYAVACEVLDEADVLTLGVVPEAQRRGHGGMLLRALTEAARAAGVKRMFLEVRAQNLPAQQLYASHGFVEIGRRRGYYPAAHGREDAIVMQRSLDSTA